MEMEDEIRKLLVKLSGKLALGNDWLLLEGKRLICKLR